MRYLMIIVMFFSAACEQTMENSKPSFITANVEDKDTDSEERVENCVEIDTNFCVDESQFPMENKDLFLEKLDAFLGCAGIPELPEMVYVRIISNTPVLADSHCNQYITEDRVVLGCSFVEDGRLTVEVDDSGLALPHELGHTTEASYNVVEFYDADMYEAGHHPCGLAVNCGDAIRKAYKNQNFPENWSEVRTNNCDWKVTVY